MHEGQIPNSTMATYHPKLLLSSHAEIAMSNAYPSLPRSYRLSIRTGQARSTTRKQTHSRKHTNTAMDAPGVTEDTCDDVVFVKGGCLL